MQALLAMEVRYGLDYITLHNNYLSYVPRYRNTAFIYLNVIEVFEGVINLSYLNRVSRGG